MENRDKRSILLSFVLGDGCLHRSGPAQRNKMGYISIKHGWKQEDYVHWKASMLSKVMNKEVKVHSAKSTVKALNKTYDQFKIQIGWKRMRAWRKFCYPNEMKSFKRILPFINHEEFALAVWLMDDGSVDASKKTRVDGTNIKVCCGLNLYLGECFKEDAEYCQKWMKEKFNIDCKLKWQAYKYKGTLRYYPHLRFNVQQSIQVWNIIKDTVISIPSMRQKFSVLEARANRSDLLQPQSRKNFREDIVQA